jgi:hypothetical protein
MKQASRVGKAAEKYEVIVCLIRGLSKQAAKAFAKGAAKRLRRRVAVRLAG